MVLATFYALGHAAMVFVLGVLAIVASFEVPDWLDDDDGPVRGRDVVGARRVRRGVARGAGRDFRMRSRWTLLYVAVRRLLRSGTWRTASDDVVVITHEHEHDERHDHAHAHDHGTARRRTPTTSARRARRTRAPSRRRRPPPRSPPRRHAARRLVHLTDARTAFGVGVLHGIGAETPTQMLLFLAAARAGGAVAGVTLLLCFVVGLVAANTIVALTATIGLLARRRATSRSTRRCRSSRRVSAWRLASSSCWARVRCCHPCSAATHVGAHPHVRNPAGSRHGRRRGPAS